MDLVTLITACALSVEPKIMHALIWEQSGGEPWSFSVPGESLPRVLPTAQDAFREARSVRPGGGRIRVGLAGLSTDPRSAAIVRFAPCSNITQAARQVTKLAERCKAASKSDPVYCAIAAYRGTWERPDHGFADAVRASVERGNAPNFDMPKDAYFDATDMASKTSAPTPKVVRSNRAPASDEDITRGWSSALFPVKPLRPHAVSDGPQNGSSAAEERSRPNEAVASATTTKAPADSLFVPRIERRP